MWSFQMTYMIPMRRARACSSPSASVAKTFARKRSTSSRSAAFVASIDQSMARPSWCSLTLEEQGRIVALAAPPSNFLSIQAASRLVPFIGWARQPSSPWYDA